MLERSWLGRVLERMEEAPEETGALVEELNIFERQLCDDGYLLLKFFLHIGQAEQRRRLERREGAHFAAYESRWMPLEERYIRQCGPEKGCQLVIDTTGFFP